MLRVISIFLFLAAMMSGASAWSAEGLKLVAVPSDSERFSDVDVLNKYQALAKYLGSQLKVPVDFSPVASPFIAAKRASRGEYDMIIAPAHTIASVLKAGFNPLCKEGGTVETFFVAGQNSKWGGIKEANGAKLGLPPFESLQASLARGELNSKAVETKKHFKEARYFRSQEAQLFALEINSMDIVAVDSAMAEKWLKSHPGKIIQRTAEAPKMAFAVNAKKISPDQEKVIESALLKYAEVETHAWKKISFSPTKREEFVSIASMLNTTPRELAGVHVIEAKQASDLIAKGVLVVDVRNEAEYLEGHVKGALQLPYHEVSAKEVGFDASEDKFDLAKLPHDKNTAMLLYCDGTHCWKSYKSALMAVRDGYKNIYWFRGGFPEWKAAGYPIDTGKTK
ncbi:MAG: PhnD/SsuA/transferrin family substrate-binding protein [Sulfurimicrobium sp.]|jgi:rhodanese-related sulfurtransferase/ABC-type phosphate/phosphonate transport system substrate-binding protein|nr:PhnD/SsuA/transferrin family substrate-binding protein [Sulfurimicrobium sp.]MDZ7655634.1 PhnD/SsuA/transferrin family substrate-binding protein [Sulfurimicrobium sp.]